MLEKCFLKLVVFCLVFALPLPLVFGAPEGIEEGHMAGYMIVPQKRVPENYNGGFSLYVKAWPLLDQYPGNRFQTGLYGTWMFAQYEEGQKPKKKAYSDIEGGLGWWRDTRFATETPKFIMGGVQLNFMAWANGPGAGKGRNWKKPKGHYGIAQLSPWILFPPDGLNLAQGTCGEMFGYGYLPLPLTSPKTQTARKDVPTGNHCWTLFLNTENFKGPVTFFTPYFWSEPSLTDPDLHGMFLDTRPARPNRALQMETQYIPSVQATDSSGEAYARIAPTYFPVSDEDGVSVVVHRVTAYTKNALWNDVEKWFEGGKPASGLIDTSESVVHNFGTNNHSNWAFRKRSQPKEKSAPIDWKQFSAGAAPDNISYGYTWKDAHVKKVDSESGPLVKLPEYFKLDKSGKKPKWIPVEEKTVPVETGLTKYRFEPPKQKPQKAYVTPQEAGSSWKKPGPAAGPFKAHIGDGSVVTYYWYRFADQPSLQNADLTSEERERMQKLVEKLHKNWTKDREYLAPPTTGSLAKIDPALLVTPPKGFEVGYVPIAVRQGLGE